LRPYPQVVKCGENNVQGATRPQFVGCCLKRTGSGSELQKVALDAKHLHRLASEAELLELMPELKPPGWEYELAQKEKTAPKRNELSRPFDAHRLASLAIFPDFVIHP